MTADKEQAAILAVIDKAVAAGMDRGVMAWAIDTVINMPVSVPLTEEAAAAVGTALGMKVMRETRAAQWPEGTTEEQKRAAEEYVRKQLRRLNW